MTKQLNKLDLINHVLRTNLRTEDKTLLVELLMRWNPKTNQCNPSVQRLCQVRGIKHEKNFKGADHYLPGLVEVFKVGRKNHYKLNRDAIAALPIFEVTLKHTPDPRNTPAPEDSYPMDDDWDEDDTPAWEGVNTPALADNTPAAADNTPAPADDTPAMEGANSSVNSSVNSSRDSSLDSGGSASAPPQDTQRILPESSSGLIVNDSGLFNKEIELMIDVDSSSGSVKNTAEGPAGPAPAGSPRFTMPEARAAMYEASGIYGVQKAEAIKLMLDPTFFPDETNAVSLAAIAAAHVVEARWV